MVRNGTERLRRCPAWSRPAPRAACRSRAATACRSRSSAGRSTDGPFHGGGGWINITPGYFDVFKIPVKRGRAFTDRDDSVAPPVVIINEAMAKQFCQGQDPLNERLVIGKGVMREFATEGERQIIGVVGDTRDGGLQQRPGAGDVHPAGAGARRRQRAEPRPGADGAGWCARSRRSVRDERRDPGAAAPGHRPAGLERALDGRRRRRARRRGSASTCG